jgi:8-oxo-dGTP diphosphatase
VISVAYFSLVPSDLMPLVKAGDDAAEARWFSIKDRDGTKDLAFDHREVLQVGLRRLRGRIDYDPVVAIQLLPRTFTVYELRAVYEAVKGDKYDPSNFRRRFKRLLEDERIEEAPGKRVGERGRPCKVYRLGRS